LNVVSTLAELRRARRELRGTFGLVPTMGFLHEGHLSLVRRAREEDDHVGVSIFVNPTQFGPAEDLQAYPRDLPRDLGMLEREGLDLVWTPPVEEVYPPGFQTWVTVEEVSTTQEGAHRPGHFRGVATVVAKLFLAFEPDRAYFGQKDAQQAVVIRCMVRDLNFPLEVVVCPTVREPDGLAMSSRNLYLNPEERRAATVLYRALTAAESQFQPGQTDAEALRAVMRDVLASEPLARAQYVSAADPESLQELHGAVERALLSMAVYVGKTRLIDNLVIGDEGSGPDPSSPARNR
jgi:pantoate--beta-alanine ligase